MGPYVQTERQDFYGKYAELLVANKKAYRCFCSEERLAKLRAEDPNAKYDRHCLHLTQEEIGAKLAAGEPYVIRQFIAEGTTTFSDAVYGDITVDNADLDDQILIKSDGLPTYNFANVNDDHMMGIIPRFLELGIYGPVAQWFTAADQVPHEEILCSLQARFGPFDRDFTHRGNGPSKYYRNEAGQIFGILDNQSDKLCRGCDRFRMSANGYIKVCNFPPIDLRPYMDSDEKIREQLLILGDVLHSRGQDYIGKRLHRNDYNFRWNHPEKNTDISD